MSRRGELTLTTISGKPALFMSVFLITFLMIKYTSLLTNKDVQEKTFLRKECEISMGTYLGPKYNLPGTTIGSPKCLLESKFVQVSKHTLQFSQDSPIINDWVWIDYHDRINVLVEAPNSPRPDSKEREWMIFQQTKYALEGRSSLAIIGGIIEPDDESAKMAAQREVHEEMKVTCNNFVFLGRFRTDVNRGMGWVNSFAALDCTEIASKNSETASNKEEVGAPDQETQNITIMSTSQVLIGLRKALFIEVQWSNTVALAMLHPTVINSGDEDFGN